MNPEFVHRDAVSEPAQISARWWDENAKDYLKEHPSLGDVHFQWCPEGWTEEDLNLLGDDPGQVLEIGAGAAQCSRWLAKRGVDVVASDVSPAMIAEAQRLNRATGVRLPLAVADARELPFDSTSFDTVFTSFGAIGFLPDLEDLFAEVGRVLRPGGRWVYSATHPFSWVFPDSPHAVDLRVIRPYAQGDAYIEGDEGELAYAEFSHTFADHINALTATGFTIEKILEPRWPAGANHTWGQWGPERGGLIPGTLIVSARKNEMFRGLTNQ